ncbi:urocanate hydratase [Bacillus paramycoides]|uniref:urocanate hydratase n=1 Tax=Bacillus paramycoides TaxID=2026194 RepID=UPI003D00CBCF
MKNVIFSPSSQNISCKSWQTEGLLRLFMNCLDPRVAENSNDLIVYGGRGKAVRNVKSFQKIIHELKNLDVNETLLIQSGKPVGVFKTFESSPRVISSTSMIVPKWATYKKFIQLENKGLTMYGQATAAAWAYIGVQGVLQATYETMAEVANRYFQGTLKGKMVLSSGLGGMGSAQPLSVTMNGGVAIIVEVDEEKIKKRLIHNYCDIIVNSTDQAIDLAKEAIQKEKPLAIALLGNASDVYYEFLEKGIIPDIVTDQTAAHDLLNGYIPSGLTLKQADYLRENKAEKYIELARKTIISHVKSMCAFQEHGAIVFDYGNNIRDQAFRAGYKLAFQFPGFVKEYLRPLYCEGRGPVRWIALSGNPSDIYKIDEVILKEFHADERICKWIHFVQEKLYFYGLPARTCWLNYDERKQIGGIINHLVASKEVSAPIAITRDHSEGSTMAAPNRETEGMPDGSDAIADWPLLTGLLNASTGATMVTIQHGGGVGIGNSIHSGMTIIADGTLECLEKLNKTLLVDPGLNIIRHADAGYPEAKVALEKLDYKSPI